MKIIWYDLIMKNIIEMSVKNKLMKNDNGNVNPYLQ